MRVLYLTPGIPDSRMVGGQMGSLFNIGQLARAGHEVTVLSIVPPGPCENDPRQVQDLAAEVRILPAARPNSPARLALNLFDPLPWPMRRYASPRYARAVADLASGGGFNLVLFNSLHSATMLPIVRRSTGAPCVLFEHNVQTTVMELFARVQRTLPARLYAALQWRKTLAFEKRVLPQFDLVLAFSEVDCRALTALAPGATLRSVPLRLDLTDYTGPVEKESFDVLFAAYFGWAPNEDSLRWFVEEIFPLVLARRPGTTLDVVGAGAPEWVRCLDGRDGAIRYRGRVEDIAPYYRRARVVVVPLRVGSGVRVKIVQAMAAARAVVTTTKGCEGLDVRSGEHLVIADSPRDFAAATTTLLEDDALRARIGARARALALERHDAFATDSPFVRECEALARRAKGAER